MLLRVRLEKIGPEDYVFSVIPQMARSRLDLKAAGSSVPNEKGERADFHAARTKLDRHQDPEKGGGSPVDAGNVLRNDPAIALKHYTPAQRARVKAIVDSLALPVPPVLEERVARSLPKSAPAERSGKDLRDRSRKRRGFARPPAIRTNSLPRHRLRNTPDRT